MEVCHIWRYAIYGGTGGVAVGIAEVAHASLHLIYVICNNKKKTSMYQDQRLVYRRGCVFFFICVFFCREKNTYGISQRLCVFVCVFFICVFLLQEKKHIWYIAEVEKVSMHPATWGGGERERWGERDPGEKDGEAHVVVGFGHAL